jgi:hypothetical protein
LRFRDGGTGCRPVHRSPGRMPGPSEEILSKQDGSFQAGSVTALPFCMGCAWQGAPTWRCKSSPGPTGGTVCRTARVSSVRLNLKEAAGKKRRPDEQKSPTRRSCRMRRPLSSKSDTCPEGMDVDAAGISVKVGAPPGKICRSALCYRHREVLGGVGRSQPRA